MEESLYDFYKSCMKIGFKSLPCGTLSWSRWALCWPYQMLLHPSLHWWNQWNQLSLDCPSHGVSQTILIIPLRPQILWNNWNLKWFPHLILSTSNWNCHLDLDPISTTEIKLARRAEWVLLQSAEWPATATSGVGNPETQVGWETQRQWFSAASHLLLP